jgi:hypothetical protein
MCPVAELLQIQNKESVSNGISLAKACPRMNGGRVVRPKYFLQDALSVKIQINFQASSLRMKYIV